MKSEEKQDNLYLGLFPSGLWVLGQKEKIHGENYLTKSMMCFLMGNRFVPQGFPAIGEHISFPTGTALVCYHVGEKVGVGIELRKAYAHWLERTDQEFEAANNPSPILAPFGNGPRLVQP